MRTDTKKKNAAERLKRAACLVLCSFLLAGCTGENAPGSEDTTPETQKTSDKTETPAGQDCGTGSSGGQKKPQNDWNFSMGKFDDYPDEYFVKWAMPVYNPLCAQFSDATVEEFNRKLEEDGYGFGLKFVPLDDTDFLEGIKNCGADIVIPRLRQEGDVLIVDQAQRAGLLEPLDGWLEGSPLYDAIPELCWEGVRSRDGIYCIPNEWSRTEGLKLYIRPGQIPEGFPNEFDGDLLKLDEYLSTDAPMQYIEASNFNFATAFGYVYDDFGYLIASDGTFHNPLEVEPVVEWLRKMNQWYHEGKLLIGYEVTENASLLLRTSYTPGWQEYYVWKGYQCHDSIGTGILASSDNKENAFRLLELIYTDHSYGELLVYGKEALDQGEGGGGINSWYLGLDTGLRWPRSRTRIFASAEEKKQYYEEYILPSPSIHLVFPEKAMYLLKIYEQYMVSPIVNGISIPGTSLVTCDDFDGRLQEFKDELKEPMDRVLQELEQQRGGEAE